LPIDEDANDNISSQPGDSPDGGGVVVDDDDVAENTETTDAAPFDLVTRTRELEVLLLVPTEPLPLARLAALTGATPRKVLRAALADLQEQIDNLGRSFELQEIARGWQFVTRPQHAEIVKRLIKDPEPPRLSRSALQTLAVVAYKQPLTRSEIESVRGAAAGPALHLLQEAGLVKIKGRKDVPGAPFLYGTTDEFLRRFGLRSLQDLPNSDQFAEEIEAEERRVVNRDGQTADSDASGHEGEE
jgi:segregation and condensation protein B